MTQDVHVGGKLQQHSIWQNGQPPEPCAVVIFGATGDLTQRKLLPTLAHLFHDHPLPEGFEVFFSRSFHCSLKVLAAKSSGA